MGNLLPTGIKRAAFLLGWLGSFAWKTKSGMRFGFLLDIVNTGRLSRELLNLGAGAVIARGVSILNPGRISVGEGSRIGEGCCLSAWERFGDQTFAPVVSIGSNCNIGADSVITAISKVEIGNNVLTGKKVLISDNSHGDSSPAHQHLPPMLRPLQCRGPVVIEDSVWIGEKASILSGVRIGRGSIIGANSVVTRDIPSHCVAVGVPAKVVRRIDTSSLLKASEHK
jgi:acetyltransferase-like isoleucine patch superfamily enzyme